MSAEVGSPLAGSFGYIEATSTWSTRYVDPSGFECLLSIQAETGSEALRKAESAISHLIEADCLPVHKGSSMDRKNGNGNKPGETVMVKPSGKGENPVCPIHNNVEMTRWSKNGRAWYSHRLKDGSWCQGKET